MTPPSATLTTQITNFVAQNPSVSDAILRDLNNDSSQTIALLKSILEGGSRCTASSYYIQGVATGRTVFLTTNLKNSTQIQVTPVGTTWLVGRRSDSTIVISDLTVSRCHAVISHNQEHGFYLIDVGSTVGTQVNHQSINPHEPYILKDRDLLEFGQIKVEFLLLPPLKLAAPAHSPSAQPISLGTILTSPPATSPSLALMPS